MNNTLSTNVQMQYMRPGQMEKAIRNFPAVYVPFGFMEWHGRHLPLGVDAIKAHAILVKSAEKYGGVVYPPVYFGETFGRDILLPVFTKLFSRLRETGFRVIIAISGHGTYNQRQIIRDAMKPIIAEGGIVGEVGSEWQLPFEENSSRKVKYMPDGRLLVDDKETYIQRDSKATCDHAAKWETSDMMFFYPDCVDISELGDGPMNFDMRPPSGIGGLDPREHASAEIGQQKAEICSDMIGKHAIKLLNSLPEQQRDFSLEAIAPGHWWSV